MTLSQDMKTLLKPYYWLNFIMSTSYILFKKLPFVCQHIFINEEIKCQFDGRESEILLFLLIVMMIRSRKSGNVTMINYLSNSYMYCKVANSILWFYADFRAGFIYVVLFLILGIMVPEPTYQGPSKVVYFRTVLSLKDEIARDPNITWLICFFTAWNVSCTNFAPVFAKLSVEYGLDNLKFGKIDVGRYPEAAKEYGINDSTISRQLPTIILFKNGIEFIRRPTMDSKRKVIRYYFTEDNVRLSFDLYNLYSTMKGKLSKKTNTKKKKKQ